MEGTLALLLAGQQGQQGQRAKAAGLGAGKVSAQAGRWYESLGLGFFFAQEETKTVS